MIQAKAEADRLGLTTQQKSSMVAALLSIGLIHSLTPTLFLSYFTLLKYVRNHTGDDAQRFQPFSNTMNDDNERREVLINLSRWYNYVDMWVSSSHCACLIHGCCKGMSRVATSHRQAFKVFIDVTFQHREGEFTHPLMQTIPQTALFFPPHGLRL